MNDEQQNQNPLDTTNYFDFLRGRTAEEKPVVEKAADAAAAPDDTESAPESGAASDAADTITPEKPDEKTAPKGVQKRIDTLTREKYELQRQLDAERRGKQAEQPALANARPPEAAAAPTAKEDLEPALEKFEKYEDWAREHSKWAVRQEFAKRDQEAVEARARQEQEETQKKVVESWTAQKKAAAEKHADFDEVMTANADMAIAHHVEQYILNSDLGGELAYHLATNPEVLETINALPPAKAFRELAKIEAAFDSPEESETPQTPVSQAPKPISPIGRDGKSASSRRPNVNDEKFASDYKSWNREREKQLAKR